MFYFTQQGQVFLFYDEEQKRGEKFQELISTTTFTKVIIKQLRLPEDPLSVLHCAKTPPPLILVRILCNWYNYYPQQTKVQGRIQFFLRSQNFCQAEHWKSETPMQFLCPKTHGLHGSARARVPSATSCQQGHTEPSEATGPKSRREASKL